MFSLLRLERKQKSSWNPFRIRIVFLFLSALLIWNLNDKYVHTQPVVPSKTIAVSRPKRAKCIECFHSRGQHLCKFIITKESVCIRKEFNSHRIGLGHQHGRRFIVLGHQYGRRDVMWKHSIPVFRPKRRKHPLYKGVSPPLLGTEYIFTDNIIKYYRNWVTFRETTRTVS